MRVEEAANELRNCTGQTGLCVDPMAIAGRLGIRIVAHFCLPEEIRGLLIIGPMQDEMALHGDLDLLERRVTAAHELGHWFEHGETQLGWFTCREVADADEALMDRFGDALLMPKEALDRLCEPMPDVETLAAWFVVPARVVRRRLAILGYKAERSWSPADERFAGFS